MADVHQEQTHEGTISQGAVEETTETTSDTGETSTTETPEVEEGPLTTEMIVKKAAKYAKKEKSAESTEKKAETKTAGKTEENSEETDETDEKVAKTGEEDGKTKEKYTPSPKFVALSKEYDLPKWALESIKNAESEQEIKNIFSKAYALDHFVNKNEELKTKFKETTQNYNELYGGINELRQIYAESLNSGNLLGLEDFFGRLKIPFDVVLNYVQQRLQFEELPDIQKQMLAGNIQAQRRARVLETQNQEFQNDAMTAASKQRSVELQQVLTRPDVAQAVQAFESAPGRTPGSFWNAVREHGEYTYLKSQGSIDLTPEEAVKQVIAKFGLNTTAPVNQPAPTQNKTQAQQTPTPVAAHKNVPVLPAVTSKATSPVGKTFRSIEDIRKYTREKYAGA